jgi:predicted RNase H-like HicB family nuclease
MKNRKIAITVERTGDGYSAYANEYGIATVGDTFADLKANVLEAVNLYMEATGAKPVAEENLQITLDLHQFFAFFKVINASALAARVGMPQSLLAQYVSGKKKPSAKQVSRILTGVKEVGRELAALELV